MILKAFGVTVIIFVAVCGVGSIAPVLLLLSASRSNVPIAIWFIMCTPYHLLCLFFVHSVCKKQQMYGFLCLLFVGLYFLIGNIIDIFFGITWPV